MSQLVLVSKDKLMCDSKYYAILLLFLYIYMMCIKYLSIYNIFKYIYKIFYIKYLWTS